MKNKSIIVFDTETTGLAKPNIVDVSEQPKIIEFAAIKLDAETLEEIDRIDFIVNPQEQIPSEITKITGLKNEDLIGEKPFIDHLEKLQEFFIGSKYLVAHNIAFDVKMLFFELKRLKRFTKFPWPPVQICTVNQTMSLANRRLNLTALHKILLGKEFEGAHRAMVDVEALTRCFKELVKRKVIKL
jgi:DNA polymerase III alpha subunit (gram-positive type)